MFAEVLLPQKVGEGKETLTYHVPENLDVKVGQLVEVQLRNKQVKGIVYALVSDEPTFKTKDVTKIVENAPHLEAWQIRLLAWIGEYYFCPLHKALKLFLPVPFIKKKKLIADIPEEASLYEFNPQHRLNKEQLEVLERFEKSDKMVSLLHGITSSGKTEIYLHIADKELKKGRQVLMLIPEISLTTQTVERFKKHFKDKVAIIHSQLTPKQKEKAWMSIHKGESRIVIGSRSSLFAPFSNLGIIIMDEEHDSSYKQDQSPRYNTLDVAIETAKLLNIRILAGSATPSLETYYRAQQGEYELLELTIRANSGSETMLPKATIVDLREEFKKKNYSIFSEKLQQKLAEMLKKKEQTLLFLNRRGAASAVICRECGYIEKCQHCDVPMTYHKRLTVEGGTYETEKLICHHCGRIGKVPTICPTCQSTYIKYIGLGTQRIEEEAMKQFPSARITRADRDTIKKRDSFERIYQALKKGEIDILIGTQMVAIGLHLPKINLVGVVLADMGLTIPNFRSSEKTFQLITQVAGRAGRKDAHGEVIIQTYLPTHYAITRAATHDFLGFYQQEIAIRKELNYPPFSKIIKLTITDVNNLRCMNNTMDLYNELKNFNKDETHDISFYPALIPKLKNRYRWHILITGPEPAKLLKQSRNLKDAIIDVDPLSTV